MGAFRGFGGPVEISGEIEGARYSVRIPADPIGKVLLVAHGYWPEDLPVKIDDGWANRTVEQLFEEGWAIGFTTYRRNGWIMEDAKRDLENLSEVVVAALRGEVEAVYVMGDSMGGGIGTLMAEDPGDRIAGVLAMGAYLFGPIGAGELAADELGEHFSRSPRIPVLYLTNVSEVEGPLAYVEAASGATVPPALWTVERSGHVNVNTAEERAALDALVVWAETGSIDRRRDGTIEMNPPSTAEISGSEGRGSIRRMIPIYGNFISGFVKADFEKLGIGQGDHFEMEARGMTARVLLGQSYGDVAVGEWISFWDADGYLLFCRNYRNAVETMGLELTDEVTVRRLD
ncbi:MAG: SAM hydroxide adenosyltransferase [Puniceicoccaceae bacterium]